MEANGDDDNEAAAAAGIGDKDETDAAVTDAALVSLFSSSTPSPSLSSVVSGGSEAGDVGEN